MSGKLEGKVALITGVSRGIGAEVAVAFAGQGAHVILVARTAGGLEEIDDRVKAAGGQATLVPLDLEDMEGIDRLGGAVAERWGHLDVLVGNAALPGQFSPVGHVAPEVWEQVFTVNVTANWRLIRAFDVLLRAADAGRAIFTTSGAARHAVPYFSPHAASKAALEAMVRCWTAELGKTEVRANLADPGRVRTKMRAAAFPGEDPMTLEPPETVVPIFMALAADDCPWQGEVVGLGDLKA